MFLFLYNKNIIPRQDRHKNYSHSVYIFVHRNTGTFTFSNYMAYIAKHMKNTYIFWTSS